MYICLYIYIYIWGVINHSSNWESPSTVKWSPATPQGSAVHIKDNVILGEGRMVKSDLVRGWLGDSIAKLVAR